MIRKLHQVLAEIAATVPYEPSLGIQQRDHDWAMYIMVLEVIDV